MTSPEVLYTKVLFHIGQFFFFFFFFRLEESAITLAGTRWQRILTLKVLSLDKVDNTNTNAINITTTTTTGSSSNNNNFTQNTKMGLLKGSTFRYRRSEISLIKNGIQVLPSNTSSS